MDVWAEYMVGIVTVIVLSFFMNKRKFNIEFWRQSTCTIVLYMIFKAILIIGVLA